SPRSSSRDAPTRSNRSPTSSASATCARSIAHTGGGRARRRARRAKCDRGRLPLVNWKTLTAVAVLAGAGPIRAACVGDEAPVAATDGGADTGVAGDASSEAATGADAGCLARPFSPPAPVPGINATPWADWDGRLSGDELSIFFASDRPTDAGRP